MLTHFARFVAYWLPENPTGEDPFMRVTRSLADFDTEREDLSTWKMDSFIVAGLFWGVTEELNLSQLQLCMKDVRDGKEYMEEGWEQVWRLNTEGMEKGFTQIVNAFDLVPHLSEDCTTAHEDWAALDRWADVFFRPFEILGLARDNIRAHEEELVKMADIAQEQLSDEEFFEFGKTFGRMNAIIVATPEAIPF